METRIAINIVVLLILLTNFVEANKPDKCGLMKTNENSTSDEHYLTLQNLTEEWFHHYSNCCNEIQKLKISFITVKSSTFSTDHLFKCFGEDWWKHVNRLELTGNTLKMISHKMFANIPEVFLIDLKRNYINSLADSSFFNLTSVVYIDLSNNQLTTIPSKAFNNLPNLGQIDLSANNIHIIESDAFFQVQKLYTLHLTDNNISSMPFEIVSSILNHPSSVLELENNPWHCDCHIVWLIQRVQNRSYPRNLICQEPFAVDMSNIDIGSLGCVKSSVNDTGKWTSPRASKEVQESRKGVPWQLIFWEEDGTHSDNLFVISTAMICTFIFVCATVASVCFWKMKIRKHRRPIQMILNPHYSHAPTGPRKQNGLQNLSIDSSTQLLKIEDKHFKDVGFTQINKYGEIRLGRLIGRGAFGDIYEGFASGGDIYDGLATDGKNYWRKVALKKIKENASHDENASLLKEYKNLSEVGPHPNIIQCYGYGVVNGSLIIVMELAQLGDLLAYLRRTELENNKVITSLDSSEEKSYLTSKHPMLFVFMWHVSRAMDYISEMKIVHRDLAARNILLMNGPVAKLSDFGLSRDVYESEYYCQDAQGRLPYKWMSPEAFLTGKYTCKSDVWSFGVLLWEIVTLGSSPYPGIPPDMLLNMHSSGYIMPEPSLCPSSLYSVMEKCWKHTPAERPSFSTLVEDLDNFIQTSTNHKYLGLLSQSKTDSDCLQQDKI